MFASVKICFVVRSDRTPNAAADWGERESGSLQCEFDARMSCGNRWHSLADRQLHRKRKISCFYRHFFKVKPSVRSQRQSVARRFAALESRPHRSNQKSDGKKAEAEGVKTVANSFHDKLFAMRGRKRLPVCKFVSPAVQESFLKHLDSPNSSVNKGL